VIQSVEREIYVILKLKQDIRTYVVIPFSDRCGFIEWVNNTIVFKNIIEELYKNINLDFKKLPDYYSKMDSFSPIDLYNQLINIYKPIFYKWFLKKFDDPSKWFESRLNYSRTLAVWSIVIKYIKKVGYIVGLGDRHCENVLFDETNGDCIQVDFDCLFEVGTRLPKPELVPFRLTRNFIDALGNS
jgi:serine/threonine-protein kinase ATR